jgi:uncharacterized protein (UPF0335 family)
VSAVAEAELEKLAGEIVAQGGKLEQRADGTPVISIPVGKPPLDATDVLYARALALVAEHSKASVSWLQRQLGLGYNSAAQLIERMEREGVVTAPDHVGRRSLIVEGQEPPPAPEVQLSMPVELPTAHRAVDDRLRLLIERVERLDEERKGISDDIRDVYAEARAVGYDTKIMRQIVRLRKMNPDDRKEMDMLLDTYRAALGLG